MTAQDNQPRLFSGVFVRRFNWGLLLATLSLCVIGVAFVFSATMVYGDPVAGARRVSDLPPHLRQVLWIVSGLALALVLTLLDYHDLVRFAWFIYAACLGLLVLVLLIGAARSGARRWLFGIQPAEFAKLAIIILLAHRHGGRYAPRDLSSYLLDLGLILLPLGLIVRQPDLGTALVFLPTSLAILFVSRVSPRALLATVLAGIILAAGVLGLLLLADRPGLDEQRRARIERATGLSAYQRQRLLVYLFPERDPHGMAWNKRQSEIAVGSGGLTGKGFMRGNQNILGFLPRTVAPTDFIFAVIAEEAGFAGSMTILGLLGLVIAAITATAVACRDGTGRLLCVGCATLIFMHTFINVAMTIGLAPITGLPLPFLSYGGSFMWVMMASMGVVQSVAVHGRREGRSGAVRRRGRPSGFKRL